MVESGHHFNTVVCAVSQTCFHLFRHATLHCKACHLFSSPHPFESSFSNLKDNCLVAQKNRNVKKTYLKSSWNHSHSLILNSLIYVQWCFSTSALLSLCKSAHKHLDTQIQIAWLLFGDVSFDLVGCEGSVAWCRRLKAGGCAGRVAGQRWLKAVGWNAVMLDGVGEKQWVVQVVSLPLSQGVMVVRVTEG